MVKLADVCWINKLQSPILICDKSDPIAFCTSVVIKWHPREGAVMDRSCWKNFMLMPVVSEDAVDWDKVVGQEVVWVVDEGRKQATTGRSKEMREIRKKCFMTVYYDKNNLRYHHHEQTKRTSCPGWWWWEDAFWWVKKISAVDVIYFQYKVQVCFSVSHLDVGRQTVLEGVGMGRTYFAFRPTYARRLQRFSVSFAQ